MKYFNADGSTAEMCGNGIRCFAKYLLDNNFITQKGKIPVDTDAGIIIPEILENSEKEAIVKVNMGKPILRNIEQIAQSPNAKGLIQIPFPLENITDNNIKNLQGTYVSMGNPHIIFFVEKGKAKNYAKEYGSEIERNTKVFPKKTNVEFVEVNSKNDVTVHVWERGAGLTLSCGTGACATLVAAILNGHVDNLAKIHLPGGTLEISWDGKEKPVFMTGPARNVFTIENLQKFLLN